MIQIGAKRTLKRLGEMLDSAIEGTFDESRYDETELSRLEARWKQYFSASKMSMEQTGREKENMKALISDISHQTKTPLSNILLYSDLLMEQTAGGEAHGIHGLAEQIHAQTEKLEFLIQSLVKMSRLENDVLEIVPVRQEIGPLLYQAAEGARARAQAKDIHIECEGTEEIECCYDFKWTLEALGNILDNAVKYSSGGSRIVVTAREFEFYLCIEVRDEGMGIRESEKAQIFGRFYRSGRVQQEEGIGIGLYLAREIVQREQGYIKVVSKEGQGSTFGIYLPKK